MPTENPTPTEPTQNEAEVTAQTPSPTLTSETAPEGTEPTAEAGAEPKADEPKKDEPPVAEPLTAESITLPEGVTVDESAMTGFLDLMNNPDLSPQERAQKLIDLQLEYAAKASEASRQAYDTMRDEWATEVRNDPKIGGAALDANLGKISKIIDQYGTPELREVMDFTGAGDHPEVVRFLLNVSNRLSEGSPTPSASPTTPQTAEERAQRLYPSMAKK